MARPKRDGRKKEKEKEGRRPNSAPHYRKRKTYGAGIKQVAWEEFDQPRRLTLTDIGNRSVYTLAAGQTEPVTLTITHNDASAQVWRIGTAEGPGITPAVHIAYDDQGNPVSIYIE